MDIRKEILLNKLKELSKYVKIQAVSKKANVNKNTLRNALYNDCSISEDKLNSIEIALKEIQDFFK